MEVYTGPLQNMHDFSKQKLVQSISKIIARQNEKCMTFRDKSLHVVCSLSMSCTCNASNKLLITRSGKYGGRKKEKRTTMTVERRWMRNSNAMVRSIFWRRRSSNSSTVWGTSGCYKIWLEYQVAIKMDVLNNNNATSGRNIQYDAFIIVDRVLNNDTVSENKEEKN